MEATKNELKSLEKRMEKAEREISDIKKDANETALKIREIEINIQQILTILNKVDKTVDDLKYKPAKKWDNVATAITTGIVMSAITYFMANGGF